MRHDDNNTPQCFTTTSYFYPLRTKFFIPTHITPPTNSPQYAILMTMVLTTFIKYLLHTVDLQSENPWDNKAVYMLYTELFTGTQPAQLWNVLLNSACEIKTKVVAAILTLEFIPGFIKVLLYIAFMTIMIKVHTFPLFAIRPMYLAMRWAEWRLIEFSHSFKYSSNE